MFPCLANCIAAGTYKLNNNVLQHQLTSATEKVQEKDCRVMFKVGMSRSREVRREGTPDESAAAPFVSVQGHGYYESGVETDYYMVGYRWYRSRKPGAKRPACGPEETCVVTEVKLQHAKTSGGWFGEAKKEETGPKDVTGMRRVPIDVYTDRANPCDAPGLYLCIQA